MLIGCSTKRPTGSTEAEILYKESMRMMEKGRYLLASEKLNTIKSKYPYSYYSSKAELLLADILFKQDNFLQAASAYIIFKDFHPKHKKVPYVIWQIAESYFNQMPEDHDRDLSPGYEALKYYSELVTKFPKSKYVKLSYSKVKKCESLIRKKEKYIADFYFKTKVYDSAIFRYKLILSTSFRGYNEIKNYFIDLACNYNFYILRL